MRSPGTVLLSAYVFESKGYINKLEDYPVELYFTPFREIRVSGLSKDTTYNIIYPVYMVIAVSNGIIDH